MRYFSALCARMYRFSANSRATISSTAIFLPQQSRQYFSSPRGSDTSLAPHTAHRDLATDLRGIDCSLALRTYVRLHTSNFSLQTCPLERRGVHALGVFAHHAPRREARRDGADRF